MKTTTDVSLVSQTKCSKATLCIGKSDNNFRHVTFMTEFGIIFLMAK